MFLILLWKSLPISREYGRAFHNEETGGMKKCNKTDVWEKGYRKHERVIKMSSMNIGDGLRMNMLEDIKLFIKKSPIACITVSI